MIEASFGPNLPRSINALAQKTLRVSPSLDVCDHAGAYPVEMHPVVAASSCRRGPHTQGRRARSSCVSETPLLHGLGLCTHGKITRPHEHTLLNNASEFSGRMI
jgi:hypothetical protein